MKLYISTTGMKRVTILSTGGGGGGGEDGGGGSGGGGKGPPAGRRISSRAVLAAALLVGTILPFFFVRIAFLVLESAAAGTSPLDCMRWRFLGGSDGSLLRDELTRALVEASQGSNIDDGGGGEKIGGVPASFKELVKDVTSNKQDLKAFAFKTKAMLLKMEHKVQSSRKREAVYWHLASHGVPKSLHCLCLKLAEEYAVNSMARSRIPRPEYVSRLAESSLHHLVLLTDNVLAASVVVSSTVKNSANPENLVFHVITDKKTYTSMHAWFATNYIESAVVEVKGLHQYDWSHEVNVGVKEILEIHRLNWGHYYSNLNGEGVQVEGVHKRSLEALSPRSLSLMNNLRLYLPELFPDLKKVVFLDDDVVVQHDLSSLWELDLKGKVNGAVVSSCPGDNCCPGRKYKDYLNFSNAFISSNFDSERCGWLYGMNVFDLQAWRRTNITVIYHKWLKLSRDSGFGLWYPGVLPPALIAFEDHVQPIDPLWHVAGLGHSPKIAPEILGNAAVVHFNGPAKPWLEIGFPEVRGIWNKHVNFSNEFVRKCRIMM